MDVQSWRFLLMSIGFAAILGAANLTGAEPYELSKNDVMDPKGIKSPEVSLFGVKLGDPDATDHA